MKTTNNKKVIVRNHAHILSHFEDVESLAKQIKAYNMPTYKALTEMVQDGFFLCYYSDVRKYLMTTLEQSEQEANKYNDSQVWELYKHLIARDGAKLLNLRG